MGFSWIKSRSTKGNISYKRLSSLNTIRVIKFKPGNAKHPIRVKLKTININTTRYTALSYTWEIDGRHDSHGSSDVDQSATGLAYTILCNGVVVPVNRNLYEALRQLRDLNSDVPVFVDRLCINFDSREERAAQTSMMGHIYGKASAVVVWVGKKTAYSSETVLIMRKLVNALDWRKLPRNFRCDLRDPSVYQSLGIDRVTLSQWRHVFAFCDAKWFSRLWTFFELVNAREATFLYGDCWMDYDFIVDFAMVLRLTGWLDGASGLAMGLGSGSSVSIASSRNTNTSRNRTVERGSTTSLEHFAAPQESVDLTTMLNGVAVIRSIPTWHPKNIEYERVMRMDYGLRTESQRAWKFLELLLQASEGFECSDPRDRILAPLAYARRVFAGQSINKEWPIVDYGTSTQTMYTHFASLIQRHTGQASILATASSTTSAPAAMPSVRGRTNRMPLD